MSARRPLVSFTFQLQATGAHLCQEKPSSTFRWFCLGLKSDVFLFLDLRNYDFSSLKCWGWERRWAQVNGPRKTVLGYCPSSARHEETRPAWADGRVMQFPLKRGKLPNGWGVNLLKGQCFGFLLAEFNVVSTSYQIKITLEAPQLR